MLKLNGIEVLFESFPNNETLLEKKSIHINPDLQTIHFKYQTDSDLIQLVILKGYLDDLTNSPSNLYIYYMPYSRMDRSQNKSPFTLMYITNLINNLDFNKVIVVEPHSEITVNLLNNSESYLVNEDLLKDVLDEAQLDLQEDYIVFPDKGAQNRYQSFNFPNVLIGEKVRDFDTGKIISLNLLGEFSADSKKALIIDDLSSFGGTFIQTANVLKSKGITEVYLLVAHAENNVLKGELLNNINKLYATDSIFDGESTDKIKVFKLEEILKKKEEN